MLQFLQNICVYPLAQFFAGAGIVVAEGDVGCCFVKGHALALPFFLVFRYFWKAGLPRVGSLSMERVICTSVPFCRRASTFSGRRIAPPPVAMIRFRSLPSFLQIADSRSRNPVSPSFSKISGIVILASSLILASVSCKVFPGQFCQKLPDERLSGSRHADEDDVAHLLLHGFDDTLIFFLKSSRRS